jgi:hypothetical protein
LLLCVKLLLREIEPLRTFIVSQASLALCYKCNANKGARDNIYFRAIREGMNRREPDCIFCATTDQKVVAQNELAFALSDNYPVTPLHTLIIPRRHAPNYFDLYDPERRAAVVQGSIAYFGKYSIDEATHVLTVDLEGSTFPNFTGGTQTRILSFNVRRGDVFQSYAVDGPQRQGDLPTREIAGAIR